MSGCDEALRSNGVWTILGRGANSIGTSLKSSRERCTETFSQKPRGANVTAASLL